VKFHSNSIYAKLGVASRTEATKVAMARGLIRSQS
jgi:DNA-binding NarL/FixJ family response regulator